MALRKHILVIRLSALGDIAMTIPLLYSLTRVYPELRLTVLSKKFARPLFKDIPNVDFLEADVYGRHRGSGLIKLANEALALGIDSVADLHNVIRSRILTSWLKLRGIRIATLDKGRREKALLTRSRDKVFNPLSSTIQRYSDVFEQLGFALEPGQLVPLPKRDMNRRIQQLFPDPRKKAVGIAPFAAYRSKAYPLEKMREVIEQLDSVCDCKIFLFGGGKAEVDALNDLALPYKNVTNIAGQLTMDDELILISNLDLMLSMDSSNGHLAAMYGLPVVTVWGVTHPYAGFAPFGQPQDQQLIPDLSKFPQIPTSIYGNKYPQGYEKAIGTIAVDRIVQKVRSVLSEPAETGI